MASQPVSSTQQQEQDFKLLPSLLSGAFDAVSGTFRSYLDHELGLGEVALANEAQAHQLAIDQQEAPVASGGGLFGASSSPAQQFNITTLALVGGLGLVIFLLLRS